jgi:hypothetical protein
MFRGDPVMKEIIDGALELREAERRRARAESESDE